MGLYCDMRVEIITGVLIFIISTFLGYQLNDYLSRDRITIQNVEVIPATKKYAIDRKRLAVINNSSHISMFSSGGYLLPDLPDELSNSQLEWLKMHLNTKKASADIFADRLSAALKNISSISDNASGKELLAATDLVSIPSLYFEPNETKKGEVLASLERAESNVKNYITTINQLIVEMDSFKSVRTGDFEIVVTLLNSGDTDGLIKYDGTMKIDSYKESIPISVDLTSPQGDYQKPMYMSYPSISDKRQSTRVEKRSMVQIIFVVDKDNVGGKIIGEIKKKVSKEQSFEISVQLVDFRGERIDSIKYRSYATD